MPKLEYPDEDEIELWNVRWDHDPNGGRTQSSEVGVDSNLAHRTAMVNWEYRFDFITKYVLGSVSTYTDDDGYLQLSRLLPTTFPGRSWLVATKCVSVTPHRQIDYDEDEDLAIFQDAVVEFLYEQTPYKLREDDEIISELERFVEFPAGNPEPTAEALNLPGAAYKFTADPAGPLAGSALDGTSIPFGLSKIIPKETFKACWHRLPFEEIWLKPETSPLYQRIFGTSEGDESPWFGAVNKAEIFGRPIGTVTLDAVFPYRRMGIDGTMELDLVFALTFRPAGHNWVYGALPGGSGNEAGWYQATTDHGFATADVLQDGKSIHNARDLNDLFRVGEIPDPPPPPPP